MLNPKVADMRVELLNLEAVKTRLEVAVDIAITTAAAIAERLQVQCHEPDRAEYAYKLETTYETIICLLNDPDTRMYVTERYRLSEVWTHSPWQIPETEDTLIEPCLATAPHDPSSLNALLELVATTKDVPTIGTRAEEAAKNYLVGFDSQVVGLIDPRGKFSALLEHWTDRDEERVQGVLKSIRAQLNQG